MKREEVTFLFKSMKRVPDHGVVVELGSFMGRSSKALAKGLLHYNKKATLYCIDFFSEEYYDAIPELKEKVKGRKIRDVFEDKMRKYPHDTMVMDTCRAARYFEKNSVDFIFIDANHTYNMVKKDIETWWPKIKTGGIMCGHDYGKSRYGVTQAVSELFKNITLIKSIWKTQNKYSDE